MWECRPHKASATEVSKCGILRDVRISERGLDLRVQVKHKMCFSYFLPRDRHDLHTLRNIFTAYRNRPMSEVENIEI
jgi:hypothetical protein